MLHTNITHVLSGAGTLFTRVWNLRSRSDHGTIGGRVSEPTVSGRGSPSTPLKMRNILELKFEGKLEPCI